MIEKHEIGLVTRSVCRVVKEYVSVAISGLVTREQLDQRLKETTAAVDDLLRSAVDRIPVPKDGKDADPEVIRVEVAKAVAALPPAKDGKDADIDFLLSAITEETAKAVAALPVPKDGRDGKDASVGAAVEALKTMLKDNSDGLTSTMIKMLKAEIPIPKDGKDGKDANPDAIRVEAQHAVNEIVSTLIQGFHEA